MIKITYLYIWFLRLYELTMMMFMKFIILIYYLYTDYFEIKLDTLFFECLYFNIIDSKNLSLIIGKKKR